MKARIKFLIYLFIIFVFVLFTLLIFHKLKLTSPGLQTPPIPTPTLMPIPSIQPMGKINISGIMVNNFLEYSKQPDRRGDYIVINNQSFQVVYLSAGNQFIITILYSPFPQVREQAEKSFLQSLGITRKSACLLNVSVGTPKFANPSYAGKSYPLSFCGNKNSPH